MKTYAYANAAGPDLWRELEAASAQPVDALMKSWIAVSGFPLVNVSASADGTVRLAQRRFFYSNSERAKAPGDTLWSIPVVVRYADDAGVHEHRVIFGAREDTVKVPVTGKLTWLYANASEIGFYRTNPDAETLRALLAHGLPHLSAVERMGLLEDQWALVRNATSTIERFLDVLEAMTRGAPAPIAITTCCARWSIAWARWRACSRTPKTRPRWLASAAGYARSSLRPWPSWACRRAPRTRRTTCSAAPSCCTPWPAWAATRPRWPRPRRWPRPSVRTHAP
jgi:hypothetical protein